MKQYEENIRHAILEIEKQKGKLGAKRRRKTRKMNGELDSSGKT